MTQHERQLPLHFQALCADTAMPLAERTAHLLHRDLQRWTRRYVRPAARIISAAAVWLIVTLKRLLPFDLASYGLLDRLSVWFLRRCVSREGGELLLRHFVVETLLLQFIARNSGLQGVTVPDLKPTKLEDLLGHAVIQHDINTYRTIIDIGMQLRACGRFKLERNEQLDFSMLEIPTIDPDAGCSRLINLDLGTALYFMNIPFALLTSQDVYEQAVNSFQLDESLLAHLANLTADDTFRAWTTRQSLSWLDLAGDVPRSLYMHAVVHEYACTHLRRLAASRANAATCA